LGENDIKKEARINPEFVRNKIKPCYRGGIKHRSKIPVLSGTAGHKGVRDGDLMNIGIWGLGQRESSKMREGHRRKLTTLRQS